MSLKSFDFFRKLNTDSETNSVIGGILTSIALLLVTVLLYNETQLYLTKQITYTAVIDNDTEQFIHIHLDVTVNVPCLALSLDQQDEVGVHRLDVQDTLQKMRMNKDGKSLKENFGEGDPNYRGSQKELDDLINGLNLNEQCRFIGFVKANKVPGNFHISYHAYPSLLQRLYSKDLSIYKRMKLDHTVHSLSFGDEINPQSLLKSYPKEFQQYFKTFRQIIKSSSKNDNLKNDYEYHLNALPARFIEKSTKVSKTLYKFSMTHAEAPKSASEMDSIYFRYQISPINMLYDIEGRSFYHFLVQLCAIIGGVFAVIGMINQVLQRMT